MIMTKDDKRWFCEKDPWLELSCKIQRKVSSFKGPFTFADFLSCNHWLKELIQLRQFLLLVFLLFVLFRFSSDLQIKQNTSQMLETLARKCRLKISVKIITCRAFCCPNLTCCVTALMNFCCLAPFLFFSPKVLSCQKRFKYTVTMT